MSDIKDEIDWEFPGAATTEAQTNYFWQGVIRKHPSQYLPDLPEQSLAADQTQGTTVKGLTDTFNNYHDYTIDWQPDTLTWSIDGNVVRTLKRSDTVDNRYPNTPSRVQLRSVPFRLAITLTCR